MKFPSTGADDLQYVVAARPLMPPGLVRSWTYPSIHFLITFHSTILARFQDIGLGIDVACSEPSTLIARFFRAHRFVL